MRECLYANYRLFLRAAVKVVVDLVDAVQVPGATQQVQDGLASGL